jgi:hypothetical protein
VPPRTIIEPGQGTNTVTAILPIAVDFDLQSVLVQVDNTGGGDTLAEVVLADPSGQVIQTHAQTEPIPAGAKGSATFARRLPVKAKGGAQASGLSWCTAEVQAAPPPGASPANFFNLQTNDPAAFAIDGFGRLVFDKVGVYEIFGEYDVSTSVASGPVANPWTLNVQGGPGSFPVPALQRLGGPFNVSGVVLSPAIQSWGRLWLVTVDVHAANVGGTLNWNWNNSTAVTLGGRAFVAVTRLADVP